MLVMKSLNSISYQLFRVLLRAFSPKNCPCVALTLSPKSGMMRGMNLFVTITSYLRALCFLLCLGASPLSYGLVVSGLYDQEIAVIGQGDAERIRAYREGLTAVILKVSGEERWLSNATVQRAIRDAQSYVQEVSYRTSSGTVEQSSFINVRFDRALVEDMLNSAGIPVWDQNRPAVMLWLSVQSADGRRELLGADSDHPIMDIVREYSQLRGIPLLFPLMDLEDRRNLPIDVAWSLNEEALRLASARYGADAILGGRVLESSNGDLVGLWQFLFRDSVESFDSFESEMKAYAENALNRVTQTLSTHFGLLKLVNPARVTLRVESIDSAKDYVDLLAYIQGLAVVDTVSAAQLDGSGIELDVSLIGNAFLFTEFIALGRDMEPLQSFAPQESVNTFYYRWVR